MEDQVRLFTKPSQLQAPVRRLVYPNQPNARQTLCDERYHEFISIVSLNIQ